MKMRKTENALKGWLFSLFLVFSSISLYAQNITVSGTVTDNVFKEPLIGVTIVIEGTSDGTVTDIDGNYTINNVPSNGSLVVSYVGMQSQIVAVNGRANIDIVLREDSELLEEVVVTGYGGTQLRSKLTNSIAKVSEKPLQWVFTLTLHKLFQVLYQVLELFSHLVTRVQLHKLYFAVEPTLMDPVHHLLWLTAS